MTESTSRPFDGTEETNAWTPTEGFHEAWFNQDEKFVRETDEQAFHLRYMNADTKKLECAKCGGDKFIVGRSFCFTALNCPACGWEHCVHSG